MELSAVKKCVLSDCDRRQILIWEGSCGTKGLETRSQEKQDEKQEVLKTQGLEFLPYFWPERMLNKERREGWEKQIYVIETGRGSTGQGLDFDF